MTPFLFLSGWSGYPELFPALAPPLVAAGRFLVPFGPEGEEETVARLAALARDLGPARASDPDTQDRLIEPNGPDEAEPDPAQKQQRPPIGRQNARPLLLAWSTGAHLVLKHRAALFPLFSRLILAAPFLSFTDHVPAAKVKLMIRGLKRDPEAVLRDFHALCRARGEQPGTSQNEEKNTKIGDGPASFVPDHVPALIQGLEFLLESRVPAPGLPFAGVKGPDIVLVRGDGDAVVPAQACRDSAALLAAEGFLPRVLVGLHGHLPPETMLSALLHESPHPPLL
jgi:alpha-beta hydrolase superfamily lysophospholipase